ncbi:MAG: ABC transporter permease [Verrucomicrobiales bacterium]|nr:ABC transporter permease [Verrucomicrobiales bacterium]
MVRFLFNRIVQALLVIWALITITFFLVRMIPGDPFAGEKNLPESVKAKLREQYDLDKPLMVQYWKTISNIALRGDFGISTKYEGRTVNDFIREAFPISLRLGLFALAIALAIGIPAGLLAAVRQNTWADYAPMSVAMLGICLPTFVLGPLLALLFGIKLGWFNVAGLYEWRDWVLPSLTLGLVYAASIARMTRGGMLEVLSQDFIRTAHAKGLHPSRIVFRHALKAGLMPVISFLGPAVAGLVTGSFILEKIFQIPGLGSHFVEAATTRDVTLIVGTAAFYAVLITGCNLLVDVLMVLLNPRLKFGS